MYLIVPKTKENGIVIRSEARSFLTGANNIFINGLLLSIAVTRCPSLANSMLAIPWAQRISRMFSCFNGDQDSEELEESLERFRGFFLEKLS